MSKPSKHSLPVVDPSIDKTQAPKEPAAVPQSSTTTEKEQALPVPEPLIIAEEEEYFFYEI